MCLVVLPRISIKGSPDPLDILIPGNEIGIVTRKVRSVRVGGVSRMNN